MPRCSPRCATTRALEGACFAFFAMRRCYRRGSLWRHNGAANPRNSRGVVIRTPVGEEPGAVLDALSVTPPEAKIAAHADAGPLANFTDES